MTPAAPDQYGVQRVAEVYQTFASAAANGEFYPTAPASPYGGTVGSYNEPVQPPTTQSTGEIPTTYSPDVPVNDVVNHSGLGIGLPLIARFAPSVPTVSTVSAPPATGFNRLNAALGRAVQPRTTTTYLPTVGTKGSGAPQDVLTVEAAPPTQRISESLQANMGVVQRGVRNVKQTKQEAQEIEDGLNRITNSADHSAIV